MPHSEDSGEGSLVVELRKHARKVKKRMPKSNIKINSNAPIHIDSVANMEEQIGDDEKEWNFESTNKN
jgi:hypothetical protein